MSLSPRVLKTAVLAGIVALALFQAPALATNGPAAVIRSTAVPGGPCGDAALGVNCQGYFPDVVRDPKGDGVDDLLMVYRWSSEHQHKPSQLRMRRSTDGGATWVDAAPFPVMSSDTEDYRDPSLSVITTGPKAGRLLLSYFVADPATGRVLGSYVRYRDTNNAAFTTPVPVTSPTIPAPVTTSKIVALANGQLLISVYGTPKGGTRQQAAIIASVDYGATWNGTLTGRQKTIGASADRHFQEPAIAEIDPGHVRIVMRTATVNAQGQQVSGPAYASDSYDGKYMTTWDTPWSLGVVMHGPELFRIPGTNRVPYLWCQPNAAVSPTNRPTVIRMRHTDVLWEDTPSHVVYDPGNNVDSGYPGSAVIGTTKMVTAVYDTASRAITVIRYDVADVDF